MKEQLKYSEQLGKKLAVLRQARSEIEYHLASLHDSMKLVQKDKETLFFKEKVIKNLEKEISAKALDENDFGDLISNQTGGS